MKTLVKLICHNCNKDFYVSRSVATTRGFKNSKHHYCSKFCQTQIKLKFPSKFVVTCSLCNKKFTKRNSEIKKSSNNFCSRSCAATYNNTHKSKGTRISKLELWLQEKLKSLYPDEEILFNDKTTINSELDIYFPRLKLAFELNGIFHYEPIFGQEKLDQIQNNDSNKFQKCQERGISLCIIDTSKEKYFKEERCQKYLDIIISIRKNGSG